MSVPPKLDRIRVQTARMLEIYSLLRRELDGEGRIGLPPADRARLQQAVDTIAANMAQLLAQLTAHVEDPSAADTAAANAAAAGGTIDYLGLGKLSGAESRELEDILDAVLKWHAVAAQNDGGE